MAWVSWDMMSRPKKEGGLGFKDLRAHNLALLGKQFWRVTINPNSLLSRMLKGKYFRYANTLSADKGSQPSWGWQSLLEGRKVVEKGISWSIGLGSNVRIWTDPWLPPPYPFIPSFSNNIATRILSIPVNADGVDKLQWIWNKRKQYDVSTGYTIAYNFYHVPTAQLSPLLQNQVIWKQIWGLKIQTKLQIFLWRAIHERLPVMHVIHRRFENTLPLCLRCRVEDETITHCLHRCGPAAATWNALFPTETVARNGSPDFATWWMQVITKNQGTETLVRIVIICWELWKARNREVFEGKKMTVEEITEVVARYC
nr:uncharacterized protein LOC112777799 [Arachis hypogaea]